MNGVVWYNAMPPQKGNDITMKQTTIDTSILPKAWLTWDTTKATFWVECATNTKSNERPNITFNYYNKDDVYYKSGSKPYYAYIKYHEDIEMLEFAAATFDTRRTAESHEWKYAGKKFFMDKKKNVFDDNGNPYNPSRYNELYTYHGAYDVKNLLAVLYKISVHPNAIKEIHKFLGANSFTMRNGRVVEIRHTWGLQEWYIRKQYDNAKPAGKGKQQLLVDKLTAIPLSDMEEICNKYPTKTIEETNTYRTYTHKRNIDGLIYFERVDDEWSVLRVFKRNHDNSYCREVERFYISDKGTNRVCTPLGVNGNWGTSKQFKEWGAYYYLANKDEAMQKCKRLKYVLPIVKEKYSDIKAPLLTILKFPEIEQLIKMGYEDIAYGFVSSNTPKADIKEMFGGVYLEKESNIIKKAGMNKHQFNTYMTAKRNGNSYARTALIEMRKYFGADFIHIDNETFNEYFIAFQNIMRSAWNGLDNYIRGLNVEYKRFIKNLVRLGKKNNNVYTLVRDTIDMYRSLNYATRPEINWYFDSYSDVARAHDAIMELQRIERAERDARYNAQRAEQMKKEEEKRKKMDKERQKMNYEDDNFIIRLPKDGVEITTEGSAQRICIGGYVSRHSLGHTNLFFLRKKSAPDTPFYAIEMNNDKQIVQIHGYCNRWLGNNPEAIPTVVRWLRQNGIKCSEHILTCTATGYGSTNTHCAMPKVD